MADRPKYDADDFEAWLAVGMRNKWCGPPVCATHDGVPMSDEEQEQDEVCVHIVRLYEDDGVAKAVEADHPPSVWRKTNRRAPIDSKPA